MVSRDIACLPQLGAIALRPAADEDYEFSFQVKKAAEGALITSVFGWDEAYQREFHLKEWVERRLALVTLDGRAVGTLELREDAATIQVAQFFILPEFEGRGMGSAILRAVVRRADEAQLTTTLTLLAGNRCESLYRRHGLVVVEDDGPLRRMTRRPRPAAPRTAGVPDIVLRLPADDEEDEVMYAHRVTSPDYPHFLHYYEEGMAFERYLEVLLAEERRGQPTADRMRATFLFAFAGARVVGRVSIRHQLDDRMRAIGGHIGYAVVPEFRRRGCATAMLRRSLEYARGRLGLERVLLTTDDTNAGSIRTIEGCGGVFAGYGMWPDIEAPRRRYWLDTAASGASTGAGSYAGTNDLLRSGEVRG